MSPPITARPMGAWDSPPPLHRWPWATCQNTMAMVVVKMGRRRTWPACETALEEFHAFTPGLVGKVHQQNGVLHRRPMSMMKPMMENMLSVEPVTSSASITPTSVKGSEAMMAIGCRKLANCDARMK